jgi:hypothetical protein
MIATDQQINDAIDLLRAQGYTVTRGRSDREWETPGELMKRLNVSFRRFHYLIEHPECPGFAKDQGPSGRLIRLRSNQALEAFLAP